MVSVIVLFPKLEVAKSIRNLLTRSGINVTAVCTTGAQAIVAIDDLDEGVVICGYRYVDMMYTELRDVMPETFEMILVASQTHYSDCAGNDVVCLSMPIKASNLISMVNMTIENIYRKKRRMKNKAKVRTEGEKAVIESAKYMLIHKKGMTEDEAHKYIQKSSMDSGTNIVETAQMILDVF